jgi:uncharacterized membrane protein
MTPTPTAGPVDPHRLVDALDRLRQDGTLTAAQVAGVLAALDARPSGAAAPRANRLVEAAAYAGGVLVAASGALLVGERWEELGRPGRVAVLAAVTVVLAATGIVVAALRPRGRAALLRPEQGVRRRLAGTILAGAAVSAAGTVALLDPGRPIPAALTAVGLMAMVQWAAPGVVTEVVTLGAVLNLAGTVLFDSPADGAGVVLAYAFIGAVWAVGARTPAITAPVPALALGLLVVLLTGAVGTWGFDESSEAAGLAVLALLAVVGLAGFVRGGRWPLAAAGTGALAALVMDISSDSLGPAIGVMLSGVLLLALALVLVVVRRRTSGTTG